jgi:hypothetical protein
MELLVSALLLVLFVVGVEFTALGAAGDGIAGLFSGMFDSADRRAWPMGVQEDDDRRYLGLSSQRKQLPREPTAASLSAWKESPWGEDAETIYWDWRAAEIVDEDVRPVPVEPVLRLS